MASVLNVRQFDLVSPAVRRNPHPVYAQMRAEAPVARLAHAEMGEHPWLLTRYNDCVNLLKDDRFTKDYRRRPGFNVADRGMEAAAMLNRHMLTVDPPDHTRLRGLVHKAFTPKMVNELSGRIQEITDDLIDQIQHQHSTDFIKDFAFPLPVTVIAELLGVPTTDRDKFREWSQTIVIEGVKGTNPDKVATMALEFMMYFHEMFDKRRAEPKDDLISGLVQIEEAGDKLEPQELISMVFLLLVAGHETTVNLIGNGTLTLLNHPDQMQLLRANPDLIQSAVEEMLRYEGPVGASSMRWAMEDVELHGQVIPAGDMVLASLLAADRDPAVFENPDTFDITRQNNKHIAFGSGIHYCLGAPLARLEGAIAINTVLRRLPNLKLAVNPDELEWGDTVLLHGLRSMPVAF